MIRAASASDTEATANEHANVIIYISALSDQVRVQVQVQVMKYCRIRSQGVRSIWEAPAAVNFSYQLADS
jgi:hypothetical protein